MSRRPSRGPLLSRRAVASGSLLGAGLLVAAGAAAPAALAQDTGTTDGGTQAQPDAQQPTVQPPLQDAPDPVMVGDGVELGGDFGTGKAFEIALDTAGAYPDDLDPSGAQFTFTDQDGNATTCTTDQTGVCDVYNSEYLAMLGALSEVTGSPAPPEDLQGLPDGSYTITQTGSVDGLAPVEGVIGSVTLSFDGIDGQMPEWATDGRIPDASLFRTSVATTVVDSATAKPVAGAAYDLTGPDYPHLPSGDPDAQAAGSDVLDAGSATSAADGTLAWTGNWFLPGTWTFTPKGTPDGYQADAGWTTTITTTADQAEDPWAAPAHALVAAPGGAPTKNPSPSTAPSTAPSPSVAPAAPSSRAPITHPSVPVPPAVQPEAAAPTTDQPAPTTEAVPTTEPSDPPAASSTPHPAPRAEPGLQTESRTLPESSLIGIGIFFVTVVFLLVLFVRRRARRG